MSLDFTNYKETENIVPIKLEGKEQYYLDLTQKLRFKMADL